MEVDNFKKCNIITVIGIEIQKLYEQVRDQKVTAVLFAYPSFQKGRTLLVVDNIYVS